MLRRHIYRLLIIVFPIATQGQWTTDAWTGPNAFRWAPGAVTYPVASNLHAQLRQVTWTVTTTNATIPAWDGQIPVHDDFYNVIGVLDFEIPAPLSNEIRRVGNTLTYTGIFSHIRFALADASLALTTNWLAHHETIYATNGVTWLVTEDFSHVETNLTLMTPEQARTYDLYEAIKERHLALGLEFDLGGPRSTRVVSNPTKYQTEIAANLKWHYGREYPAALIPGIIKPAYFQASLTNRYYYYGRWRIDDRGWSGLGWAPSLGISSTEKIKILLKEMLPQFVDVSLMEGGNLNGYFASLDSKNPDAWQWRNYATAWYAEPTHEGPWGPSDDGFDRAYATASNTYWEVERYPETIPMTSLESFFKAHPNIPHYFRPTIVTNRQSMFPWEDFDWLIKGWQIGDTNSYYAPPDAIITNYTLEATWFDWTPDRSTRWMSDTHYGHVATTTWSIATQGKDFSYNYITPLIDSLGLDQTAVKLVPTIVTGHVQKVKLEVYTRINDWTEYSPVYMLHREQEFLEPTNVTVVGISTNRFIAPGFNVSDYGIQHATTVVAAMQYTLTGLTSNSTWVVEETNEWDRLSIYLSGGELVTNSSIGVDVTFDTGTVYATTPPPKFGDRAVNETIMHKHTYSERSRTVTVVEPEESYDVYYYWRTDNDERRSDCMSFNAHFYAAPGATNEQIQFYAIYPRRFDRQLLLISWPTLPSFPISIAPTYKMAQRPYHRGNANNGGELIAVQSYSGGPITYEYGSAIEKAGEMTLSVYDEGSQSAPYESETHEKLSEILEYRSISTKPAAVIKWDFHYQ